MGKRIIKIKKKILSSIQDERRRIVKKNAKLLNDGKKPEYDQNCYYLLGISFVSNLIRRNEVK